jgi:hypothetical protein
MEAVWTPCRDLNSDHRLRRSISYSVRRQGDFPKKELAYVVLVRRANVILEKNAEWPNHPASLYISRELL